MAQRTVIVALATTFVGCGKSDPAVVSSAQIARAESVPPDFRIRVSAEDGGLRASRYYVELDAAGHVAYGGIKNCVHIGSASFEIEPAAVAAVWAVIRDRDFLDGSKDYDDYSADVPIWRISVTAVGAQRLMSVRWSGQDQPPDVSSFWSIYNAVLDSTDVRPLIAAQ